MFWFRVLQFMLLAIGTTLVCALVPMCFPFEWMASIHQWLGLGELPESAITSYLARSTSLMYAVHGSVMFYVGWHLRQHLSMIPFFALLNVLIGLILIGIDLGSGMPMYWTVSEGPMVSVGGIVLFWLHSKAKTELPEN
ncbi:MAG: hypothetical protein AAFN77_18980 [Planctomycetota bacterium]